MNCLRCGNPTGRKAQAQYCAECRKIVEFERHQGYREGIYPERKCFRCQDPLDRKKANAKYCKACLKIVERENVIARLGPLESRRSDNPKMNWRSEEYLGLKPSQFDWARLAAYIDGEGSIGLSPRKTDTGNSLTFCGVVTIANTDPRLAVWCFETFGMKFLAKKHGWNPDRAIERNWKTCYASRAIGYRAAWICLNCLPWFLLKKEQAEVLISHQKTTAAGNFERARGAKTPAKLLEYRLSLKNRITELNSRGPKSTENQEETPYLQTIVS